VRTASVAAPAPGSRRARPASATSVDPLTDRDAVVAGVGMVLVDQGQQWTITGLADDAAIAERDGATRRFTVGSAVVTAGRQRGALTLPGPSLDPHTGAILDELRVLRERVRNGKPAYIVFDDKTLAAIAAARPSTRRELGAVKGVGPAKIEQYGDDVLEVVARFPSATT
jgi:superfamily II DNA helicase RecQ